MKRSDIITAARKWLDVKWQHQGRGLAGIDCAGVVVNVALEFGVPVDERTDYQRRTHGTQFLQRFRDCFDEKPVALLREGCIVTLTEPAFPCHCGIISRKHGELYLIHGYAKRRKVVEELFDKLWRDKLVAVFDYPGVED